MTGFTVCATTCSFSWCNFTGKERDAESGNDYFGARYYASSMGRFMSPDPVKITPGRMANPQQLNLYSYVANNPLRFIDPDGETLQISGNVDEAAGGPVIKSL
jgi:RHS repeat-associated protein